MNKKIIRDKGRIKKNKSSVGNNFFTWKKFFLLVALLFMTAFTVIVTQNKQTQTLIQHADVTYSSITPQYHCLTLGSSNCSGVATDAVTTCPGLTVVTPLKLTPNYSSLGGTVQASITYENECSVPYEISSISIGDSGPNGTTDTFVGASQTFNPYQTIVSGQKVTITGTLTVTSHDTAGNWTAYGEYTNYNTGVSQKSPSVPFTICGPLTVSKDITLNKTTVYPGQTITGQITYKNACSAKYMVNAMEISSTDPNGGVHVFTPTHGPTTFNPGQEITVTASRLMSANASGDPLGTWKAFGSYENMAGTWINGDTANPSKSLLSFVLELQPVPAPSSSGSTSSPSSSSSASTPSSSSSAKKSTNICATLPSELTKVLTVYFQTDAGSNNGYTLTSADTSSLDTYATDLKKYTTVSVTINGYTDSTPFAGGTVGPINSNQALSLARANAVEKYLKSKSAATKYTAKGAGVAPGATNDDPAARKADVISSCSSSSGSGSTSGGTASKTPASTGKTTTNPAPAGGASSTCTTNCGQSTACENLGGTCEAKGTHTSGGNYVAGICPGGSTWECWVPVCSSAGPNSLSCKNANGNGTSGNTTATACALAGGDCTNSPPPNGQYTMLNESCGTGGGTCIKATTTVTTVSPSTCKAKNLYYYDDSCVSSCPVHNPPYIIVSNACIISSPGTLN